MGIYTKEEQFKLIQENPFNLEIIDNQYEDVCLEAIKTNGVVLKYVKEQTYELCLEAVKQHRYALDYVKEQTPEICLEAVKKHGTALEYVREQTPEVCLAAVKRNGLELEYVKEQTEELCLEAVKEDGFALEYVKEQTLEICIEAVKQHRYAIQYIKEQTSQIFIESINQNKSSIEYLNNSMNKWYKDILKYGILRLNDNEDIDFSKYCFYISDSIFEFELKNVKSKYVKNLEIIDLPYHMISKNNFFDYLVELNSEFAFIIDDSLNKEIWNKLILSNNYIIGLENTDNAKYYSKLLDYVMKEDEFELFCDNDDIPF